MKKGFTLIEIMVTLTIVAVLGATTIPSMVGYIDDRKAKECQIVRDEMVKMYEVARRDGDRDVSVADFTQFIQGNWGSSNQCPSGAKYRIPAAGREPKTEIINIIFLCDIHGSNNRNGLYVTGKILQDKYNEIINTKGLNTEQKRKLIKEEMEKISGKEFKFPYGNEHLNNEAFRQILMDGTNGKWETLDKAISDKIGGKELYVQAYIQPEGDVVIYANGTNALKSWDATAIYNPEDGYWYKPKVGAIPKYKGVSDLNNKEHNWETVKADLAINWERVSL